MRNCHLLQQLLCSALFLCWLELQQSCGLWVLCRVTQGLGGQQSF
jgi:hypothetical protein